MKMKKTVALILSLVMIISLLPGQAIAVLADALSPTDYSVEVGNVRVQLLSDTLARVEVKGPKGYEDRPTYHIVGREWDGVSSEVVSDGDTTYIITDNYTVHVPNDADSLQDIRITNSRGREIWKYTSLPSAEVYLPEPGDVPNAWAIADNPRVVPAEWGYSPMPETVEDNGYNGWDLDNGAPDMYIFMPQGEYRQLLKDFITLTGEQELITLKSLGLWHSRYHEYDQDDVVRIINEYREEGFPLDFFVVDTDWRTKQPGVTNGSGYEINRELFPDMEELLVSLNEDYNVRTMFNDHPGPVKVNGVEQHALTQADLQFRNENLRRMLDMNMNHWWFDRNWETTIKPPISGINKESFGMYLYQDIARDNNEGLRPMIMGNVDGIDNGAFNRAPNIASHRFTLQWTGDTNNRASDLLQELEDVVLAGAITANAFISTDVGGHNGVVLPEQWTRWTQFATFSPFFRYHCTSEYWGANDRAPYLFGDDAQAVAQEYIAMRYRMLPVLYSVSHENYETGLPITKRLDYNYPNYAESKDNTQYLIGDNMLVAPIWEAGGDPAAIPGAWLSQDAAGNEAGLKAEYFNNTSLTPPAALERVDEDVDFNWGTGSPASEVNRDNFSARWTGYITIGSEDTKLALNCDDGVRLYIDGDLIIDEWKPNDNRTYMTEEIFEAGTTHEVKLEYYEGSGNALVKFMYLPVDQNVNTRSVFIPDGRWIDVWTGEEFEGPQTIEVTHSLETSPLFVRSGSILPLVDNVEYIGEKPWDAMTLDVYPSTQLDGSFEIYEDDGESIGYKDGNYRTTDVNTTFDKATGEVVVNIEKAEGSFDGSDAFDSREWNVRIHMPESWGSLEGIKLDGAATSEYTFNTKGSREEASPLALNGKALDSNIYEIKFTKSLADTSEVRIKMSTPQDEKIPEYKDVSVDMEVESKFLGNNVDLTNTGNYDWAHFNAEAGSAAVTRKANNASIIGDIAVAGTAQSSEGPVTFEWTDATGNKAGSTNAGLSVENGSIEVDIAVGTEDRLIQLFVGGQNASGRLEITDGSNKSAKVVELSALNGVFKNRIQILASADEATTLNIKYVMTEGTGLITMYGAAVSDPVDGSAGEVTRFAYMENAPDTVNLADENNIDWVHIGLDRNPSALNRKAGVEPLLSEPVTEGEVLEVHDYHSKISFSDGYPTASTNNSQNAFSCKGSVEISVPSTNVWRELKLYFGVWNGTNNVEIYDESGNEISKYSFSAGSSANTRVLTVQFKSEEDSTIYVKWSKSGGTEHGNVSLAAYSLSEIGENTDNISATLESVPNELNMSADQIVEWAHYGYQGATNNNRKADAETNMLGEPRTLIGNLLLATDYKTKFSWNDGTNNPEVNGTQHFTHSFEVMELDLNMEPGNWNVDVYTSVWWGKGYIELVDENGAMIDTYSFEHQTDGSLHQKLAITYDCAEAQKLTVRVMSSQSDGGHTGNMSIVAATVERGEEAEAPEIQELEKALTAAEIVLENTVMPSSLENDLKTAAAAAKAMIEKVNSGDFAGITQEAVDKLAEDIDTLLASISALPSRKILKYWIDEAEKADGGTEYNNAVPKVQEEFDNALTNAKQVFENVGASQAEIYSAAWNMMYKIHALGIYPGDKTLLEEIVDKYGHEDFLAQYVDDADKDNFVELLKDAKDLLDDANATEDVIAQMIQDIEDAKDKMTLKDADLDYSDLIEIIREAEELLKKLDNYVDAKQDEFKNALNEAKALIGNAEDQNEITAMEKKLLDAMSALRLKANKDSLQSLYEEFEGLSLDGYTEGSVKAFMAAMLQAKAILDDPTLSEDDQDVVDAMEIALQAAYDALTKDGVNKDKLKETIEDAKKLNKDDYTEETWGVLVKALEDAITVYEDADATQEEVDKAMANLANAIAMLKKKDTDPGQSDSNGSTGSTDDTKDTKDTKDPKDTNGSGAGKDSGKSKTTSPKTGDALPIVTILLFSLAGITVLLAKKRRER